MVNIHKQVSLAVLENQAISLLGRLHVMLRRESGRITDIEYMRHDPVYCRHVLELAWNSASPDMRMISDKLAHLYFDPDGLFNRVAEKPLMERLLAKEAPPRSTLPDILHTPLPAPVPAAPPAAAHAHDAEAEHDREVEHDRTYVGRLR